VTDGFCRNCTVLKGKVGLETMDGKTVGPKDGMYIHHILSFDTSKRQKSFISSCGGVTSALGAMGSKFVGSGEDNNNVVSWGEGVFSLFSVLFSFVERIGPDGV
jgi:hypothetical protein